MRILFKKKEGGTKLYLEKQGNLQLTYIVN
jgi:hypothetical protein